MTLTVDETTGVIQTYQGDSGDVTFVGFMPDKSYTVYFSIYNNKRRIIDEISTSISNTDRVTFTIPSSMTDNLTVPQNQEYQTYYYGIKKTDSGTSGEDTMFVKGTTYGDLFEFIVYPKKVEGSI